MRLEFLERYSEGDGPLHRLDARVKLVATLAYVVAVVVLPVGWWHGLAALGLVLAFVVGLSGVPPRELLVLYREQRPTHQSQQRDHPPGRK